MVEITSGTAIMIYLGLTLSVLLGLWLYQHYYRLQKKPIISSQKLLICEYCQTAYVEDISKKVTQCPECRSYNKNNSYRDRKRD